MSPTDLRRRGLIAVLGTLPIAAAAQGPRKPRIALLESRPEGPSDGNLRRRIEAGLAERGIPAVEFRFFYPVDDSVPRMDEAARQAVAWGPDAILTPGPVATMAAQKATRSIPVVFFSVPDPVEFGFVQSSSRPGGNLTGSAWDGAAQTLKRLELGREMLPRAKSVVALIRTRPGGLPGLMARVRARFREMSTQLGLEVREEDVGENGRGLKATLAAISRRPPQLLVGFGPYDWEPDGESDSIGELLEFERRHGTLYVFDSPEAVKRGGSIAVYSTSGGLPPALVVLARVLNGMPPAVVPVEYGLKYAIAVNPRAAKARGLAIPDSILVRADEVLG